MLTYSDIEHLGEELGWSPAQCEALVMSLNGVLEHLKVVQEKNGSEFTGFGLKGREGSMYLIAATTEEQVYRAMIELVAVYFLSIREADWLAAIHMWVSMGLQILGANEDD
mgnify:CR=1 FL=1